MSKHVRTLSVFTLAMINVAAVSSIKNWPFISELGLSSLFYFLLAALFFFFPVALVSAELATGWPHKGGVLSWVTEAFGPRWGFLAIWLQWIENVVWYPTILAFAISTIAYIFDPSLASNLNFTVFGVLSLFWIATLSNLFGMKASGWLSSFGAICGTLIPGCIIIALGFFWISSGAPLEISFSWDRFLPNFAFKEMVFFTGVLLSFCGLEMSAVHALDVKNPQKNYPRATFLSALIIFVPMVLGVLSIAAVVPQKDISLTAGTMQAFTIFFAKYKLSKFIPLIALVMAIGFFGSVCTWIIGPTKGILAAAQKGYLPPFFHRENKNGAPSHILLLQGAIVTILTLVFLLMPSVSSGFWMMTVLSAQLYLIMYILLFLAALYLRYSKPDVVRVYKVPFGKVGMWITCLCGIAGSLFALLIGYVPPNAIQVGSPALYTGFLIVGTFLGCGAPFYIFARKKASWKKDF